MAQLIPENTSRQLDSLGRITLPKGLRDRMYLTEGSELELFTASVDGRRCIVLSTPLDEEAEIEAAKAVLAKYGIRDS